MQHHAVRIVHETYTSLATQQDLSPRNPVVNTLLSRLVSCLEDCQHQGHGAGLAQLAELALERTGLPGLCGHAEGEMELYWAEVFNRRDRLTAADLAEFWYFANYQKLWQLEAQLSSGGGALPGIRTVFLGSGPLPLTAVLAAWQFPGTPIVCVDSDAAACAASAALLDKLGLSRQVEVIHAMAQAFPFQPEDFVICASLISRKAELYDVLHRQGVRQFMVRDAEEAYCYLYEPAPLPPGAQYRELRRTLLTPGCINTSRFYARV